MNAVQSAPQGLTVMRTSLDCSLNWGLGREQALKAGAKPLKLARINHFRANLGYVILLVTRFHLARVGAVITIPTPEAVDSVRVSAVAIRAKSMGIAPSAPKEAFSIK